MRKERPTDKYTRTNKPGPVPREVATELLCTQTVMTGKERRALSRARERVIEIPRFDHLGVEHRLDYRLQQRNWGQLCKWLKRAQARRNDAQCKFVIVQRRQEKLGKKTGQPSDSDIQELLKLQEVVAALNMKAKLLEIFIDAVESEIARRQKLWESVAKAGAPEFAKRLKEELTK